MSSIYPRFKEIEDVVNQRLDPTIMRWNEEFLEKCESALTALAKGGKVKVSSDSSIVMEAVHDYLTSFDAIKGTDWKYDRDGRPTACYVAYQLWGGDAARSLS